MGGEQAAIAALTRGDIDVAETSYAGAIAAIEQGAKLRLVLTERRVLEFLLVARHGIDSVAQLRGKRIAEDGPGGGGTVFVTAALQRAGLGPKDATLITLRDSPSRAAALAAGRIDASPLEFVDFERIRAKTSGLKVLTTAAKTVPHEPLGVFVASQREITDHPDVVQKFVDAVLDANAFFSTPAGERRWIADAKRTVLAGDPPSLVQDTYNYYKRISLYPLRNDPITPAEYEHSMRSFLAAKQVERVDQFGAIWDLSFWRHAKPL
jgi:ABC-type nitrate/sulfonate/bicarbonate transport system substrate-binding protein